VPGPSLAKTGRGDTLSKQRPNNTKLTQNNIPHLANFWEKCSEIILGLLKYNQK